MADEMISLGAKLKLLAGLKPDAPAVSCGEVTLTYGEFHRQSNRAARGLASYGVKHGDLVTLGLPNSVDFVVACFAIWKLGATPQPVSFRLPKADNQSKVRLRFAQAGTGSWYFGIDNVGFYSITQVAPPQFTAQPGAALAFPMLTVANVVNGPDGLYLGTRASDAASVFTLEHPLMTFVVGARNGAMAGRVGIFVP